MTAARSIGAGRFAFLFRHILPNCLSPLIVQITLVIGLASNLFTSIFVSKTIFEVELANRRQATTLSI